MKHHAPSDLPEAGIEPMHVLYRICINTSTSWYASRKEERTSTYDTRQEIMQTCILPGGYIAKKKTAALAA